MRAARRACFGSFARPLCIPALAFITQGAPAQTTAEADTGHVIEEILVTARKREEPLEKVPVSVTVVTGADLQKTYAGSLVDITSASPDIVFHTVGEFGHSSSLDIRGVGGGGANYDTDPAVAIYVDGQYQTANTINLESLVGIDSIDDRYYASIWGRNLTDKVVTEVGVLAYPLFSLWNPTPPRTVGLTVGARFGSRPVP